MTSFWGESGTCRRGRGGEGSGVRQGDRRAHHGVDLADVPAGDPVATVFGVEMEPEYFLPPYSLFKWGGKH
ncbi:MAG: hypothetical protein R3F14_05365 [Polyangiaceae bacterium]